MSEDGVRGTEDHEVDLAESSRAMVGLLTRVPTFDSLLELICECAKYDRAEQDLSTPTPHLWLCAAGTVEFWLSRHPAATIAWLDQVRSDDALPPEPAW